MILLKGFFVANNGSSGRTTGWALSTKGTAAVRTQPVFKKVIKKIVVYREETIDNDEHKSRDPLHEKEKDYKKPVE